MTATTSPAVAVRGVRKSFGRTRVLDGLDLTVDRGTVFALLGPNGAGKTTTLNILCTLVAPDAGTAAVNGYDVVRQPDRVKASISVTGQAAAVDEVLSGEENLRMMGRLSGLTPAEARRRAGELLERFDLRGSARKRVGTWSGGMRRKLDIAISLLRTPPVIFLDEPTTGLDPEGRLEVWRAVKELAAGGTTVLLTTQYLDEAEQLADRIAILHEGRIIVDDTLAELKKMLPPAKVEYIEKQPTLEDVFLALVGTDK